MPVPMESLAGESLTAGTCLPLPVAGCEFREGHLATLPVFSHPQVGPGGMTGLQIGMIEGRKGARKIPAGPQIIVYTFQNDARRAEPGVLPSGPAS